MRKSILKDAETALSFLLETWDDNTLPVNALKRVIADLKKRMR